MVMPPNPSNGTADTGSGQPPPISAQIVSFLEKISAPEIVFELRALRVKGSGRPHTEAGYFDSANFSKMAQAALTLTEKSTGVYFKLNPVKTELLARRCNRIDWADGDLTKDGDISSRGLLLIDIDPVRVSGVSATDYEKECARQLIIEIRNFLQSRAWPAPILNDSGNGFHLFYRIDLPTDDGGIVKRILEALAARFDNDHAKVDLSVHNPGTKARKGDSTAERPHRRALVLDAPETFATVPANLLKDLAEEAPEQQKPKAPHRPGEDGQEFTSRLLVEKWLQDSDREFRRKTELDNLGRTVWVLRYCPFDEGHGDPDSCVMQGADGKMSANCFHNSCHGRGWHDFKEAIGPTRRHHYDPPLPRPTRSRKKKFPPDANATAAEKPPSRDTIKRNGEDEERSKPLLLAQDIDLALTTCQVWKALQQNNEPPTLFRHGALPARIEMDDDNLPFLRLMTLDRMRHRIAREVDFYKVVKKGKEDVEVPSPPLWDVVKDVLACPDTPLPVLTRIVEAPVFAADGTLQTEPGYCAANGTFYAPAKGFTVRCVSMILRQFHTKF